MAIVVGLLECPSEVARCATDVVAMTVNVESNFNTSVNSKIQLHII